MKKLSVFGAVIAIACAAVFTGCSSTNEAQRNSQNWGAFGDVLVPVKDFESKGIVFTEISFTVNDDGEIKGKTFTYQELLKAAQKVGADAIVNVTIDKVVEKVTKEMGFSKDAEIKETWYGSALAIKYTTALTQSDITVSPIRNRTFNNGAASTSSQEERTSLLEQLQQKSRKK
ncbi:hypothetical protein R84B8_00123 [Treponema sp. R8-4-B8]